jgi:hypothetical protein
LAACVDGHQASDGTRVSQGGVRFV